jgi:hypothetical protein
VVRHETKATTQFEDLFDAFVSEKLIKHVAPRHDDDRQNAPQVQQRR